MSKQNLSLYQLLLQHFIENETILKVKANTVLFQEKDPVNHIFLLLKGSIGLGRVHMKGKEFILKIINGNEL